jgi:hypothetical protein
VTSDRPIRPGPPIALFIDADDPALREHSEYGPLVKHPVLGSLLPLDRHRPAAAADLMGLADAAGLPAGEADTDGTVTLNQDLFLL